MTISMEETRLLSTCVCRVERAFPPPLKVEFRRYDYDTQAGVCVSNDKEGEGCRRYIFYLIRESPIEFNDKGDATDWKQTGILAQDKPLVVLRHEIERGKKFFKALEE